MRAKTRTVFRLTSCFLSLLALVLSVSCVTSKKVAPTAVEPESHRVTGLTARFDPEIMQVRLSWDAVSLPTLAGYRIYREWADTSGPACFQSPLARIATSNHFSDPPGLADSVYYYKVAALWVESRLHGDPPEARADTLEGELSEACSVVVSSNEVGGVLIINGGDLYTVTDVVQLSLRPLENFSSFRVLTDSGVTVVTTNPTANPIASVRLPQRGGPKTVHVEVVNSADGTMQTLSDVISIAPSYAKIIVENEDFTVQTTGAAGKITSQKQIHFKIQLLGDTTFNPTAQVSVLTTANGEAFIPDNLEAGLLESNPATYPVGKAFEETLNMYDMMDPANANGFSVDGIEDPGSFFYLQTGFAYTPGRKEFIVKAKLTGRFFNDERIFTSRITKTTLYWWDLYPPAVAFCGGDIVREKHTPQPGDTVTGPFDVKLSEGSAIIDYAGSPPVEAVLYFAKTGGFTLSDILGSRNDFFRIEFDNRNYIQRKVKWENIDPGHWTSGDYMMAIVTKDSRGNRGIAPFQKASGDAEGQQQNPRPIFVQSIE